MRYRRVFTFCFSLSSESEPGRETEAKLQRVLESVFVQNTLNRSSYRSAFIFLLCLQVLKYLDYIFTGVFTFEMVIKVRTCFSHLFRFVAKFSPEVLD